MTTLRRTLYQARGISASNSSANADCARGRQIEEVALAKRKGRILARYLPDRHS